MSWVESRFGVEEPRANPLTRMQEFMWMRMAFGRDEGLYLYLNERYGPSVGLDHIERLVKWLVMRHPALRYRIYRESGELAQSPVALSQIADLALTHVSWNSNSEAPWELVNKKDIDISRPPIFNAFLLEDEQTGSKRLVLKVPHVISDATSILMLRKDLRLSAPSNLEHKRGVVSLPDSFGAYALKNRQRLTAEETDLHLNFWRKTIEDFEFPLLQPTHDSGAYHVQMTTGSSLAQDLTSCAKRFRTTPFVLFVAGLHICVSSLFNIKRVLTHSVISNRISSDEHSAVGCFVNQILLGSHSPNVLTPTATIAEIHQSLAKAHRFQNIPPFEVMRKDFSRIGSLLRAPLIQLFPWEPLQVRSGAPDLKPDSQRNWVPGPTVGEPILVKHQPKIHDVVLNISLPSRGGYPVNLVLSEGTYGRSDDAMDFARKYLRVLQRIVSVA